MIRHLDRQRESGWVTLSSCPIGEQRGGGEHHGRKERKEGIEEGKQLCCHERIIQRQDVFFTQISVTAECFRVVQVCVRVCVCNVCIQWQLRLKHIQASHACSFILSSEVLMFSSSGSYFHSSDHPSKPLILVYFTTGICIK